MPQEAADDINLFDEGNQPQPPPAPGTRQHVHPERPRHQRRPALAAGLPARRLHGVRHAGRLGRGSPVRHAVPARAGQGRGLWAANGDRTPWSIEGGKGTKPLVAHFQLRPDPLAK